MNGLRIEFWWAVHNLIAHPLMQLLWWLSLCGRIGPVAAAGDWLHDATAPETVPETVLEHESGQWTAASLDDPIAVPNLAPLRDLKPGWLNPHTGEGLVPDPAGLAWLANAFAVHWPAYAPVPYIFPTPEGCVEAEWDMRPWAPSLKIDLATRQGEWFACNVDTQEEDDGNCGGIPLDGERGAAGWQWVARRVARAVSLNAGKG